MNTTIAILLLALFVYAVTAFCFLLIVMYFMVDDTYGIFNRKTFDLFFQAVKILGLRPKFIFADLDGMHKLNDIHTHAGVDRMIKAALSSFRNGHSLRTPDLVFRYYSGDEFMIVVLKGDPMIAAERCLSVLIKYGLNATVCVADNMGDSISGVELMKKSNLRGRIIKYTDVNKLVKKYETFELLEKLFVYPISNN